MTTIQPGRKIVPIYEYKCEACEHSLEALQKISDDPLRECPACGKPALKKQVTAAAFKLKGGGWYETDFKNKSKPQGQQADKKSESSGKDGSDSGANASKADKPGTDNKASAKSAEG